MTKDGYFANKNHDNPAETILKGIGETTNLSKDPSKFWVENENAATFPDDEKYVHGSAEEPWELFYKR